MAKVAGRTGLVAVTACWSVVAMACLGRSGCVVKRENELQVGR